MLAFLGHRARADQYCEPTQPPYYRRYLVGCNLSLDSIAQDGSQYDPWMGGYAIYVYDATIPGWTLPPPAMPRGWGATIMAEGTNFCFNEPTQALVLPLQLPVGYYVPVSCQSNVVANYSNGVWTPSVPVAAIGEAVLVYQPTQFVYQPVALNPGVDSGQFKFEVETVYGKSVTIEYADTLDPPDWQKLTTFVGDGHLNTVVDDNPTALLVQRFYRISSTVP